MARILVLLIRLMLRSSRSGNSSRGTSQRANVFNARDELERERELYSAHDPRQNALSPAQRYAQAKKEQDEANRQCYWSQHPEAARAHRE